MYYPLRNKHMNPSFGKGRDSRRKRVNQVKDRKVNVEEREDGWVEEGRGSRERRWVEMAAPRRILSPECKYALGDYHSVPGSTFGALFP